jgi:hypothetical protein
LPLLLRDLPVEATMTRLFLALLLASAPLQAQSVISQGMTPEQVRETFGAPATTRTSGEWTYWYYHNGCPNRCGSDDVVFFREDRVVAAVLRTRARRFSGPRADDALGAAGGGEQSGSVTADAGTADDRGRAVGRAAGSAPGRVIVGGVNVNAAPTTGADVMVITPTGQGAADGVQVREAREGERSTIIIQGPATTGGTGVTTGGAPANRPNVDATSTAPRTTTGTPDETQGDSVERAAERDQRDRRNEETAVDRARRHDTPRQPPARTP